MSATDQSNMTARRRRWVDRRFEHGRAAAELPEIVERLRGTPARLDERLRGVPVSVLTPRLGDHWSIQENVGHLLDLEPLWLGRLDDIADGAETLRPADITNRATTEAGHNDRRLADLLHAFRAARARLVERLERIAGKDFGRTAIHPRLREPMNAVDLAYFVAEHDDHHLATITELLASPR